MDAILAKLLKVYLLFAQIIIQNARIPKSHIVRINPTKCLSKQNLFQMDARHGLTDVSHAKSWTEKQIVKIKIFLVALILANPIVVLSIQKMSAFYGMMVVMVVNS